MKKNKVMVGVDLEKFIPIAKKLAGPRLQALLHSLYWGSSDHVNHVSLEEYLKEKLDMDDSSIKDFLASLVKTGVIMEVSKGAYGVNQEYFVHIEVQPEDKIKE